MKLSTPAGRKTMVHRGQTAVIRTYIQTRISRDIFLALAQI